MSYLSWGNMSIKPVWFHPPALVSVDSDVENREVHVHINFQQGFIMIQESIELHLQLATVCPNSSICRKWRLKTYSSMSKVLV